MERLRQAIIARLEEKDISIRAVARSCGISEGSIRNILKGRVEMPRIDTLEKICHACGTSVAAILESQHRTVITVPDCVESYAECVISDKKCVESDAKASAAPDKNDVNTTDSKNVYSSGRIFPDENGDEALLMCHSLANTGHSFHGDADAMQIRLALEENAEAEIRDAQARLERAIAAREKLKGGGK